MLPQNAHARQPGQHPSDSSFMSNNPNPSFDPPAYFNLDPAQAKQMAAINAANQVRSRASIGGGTSSGPYLGGINPTHDPTAGHPSFSLPNAPGLPQAPNPGMNAAFLDPAMAHSNAAVRNSSQPGSIKQRQAGFLNGLARIMASRGTPLPPALTGTETPTYDPNTTQWKMLEVTDMGAFRLAGRDVDLFKLWGLVFQNGGGTAVSRDNGWHSILPHFDLPEEYPLPHGSTSVAQALAQYYIAILLPFEEVYRNNIQNQHRKAQASRQAGLQGLPPATPARPDGTSPQRAGQTNVPQTPTRRLSSASQGSAPTASAEASGLLPDSNGFDQELGTKRKLESEEHDNKRVRQKTEPLDSLASANGVSQPTAPVPAPSAPTAMPTSVRRQRRKIEYVPLAREIDTVGGRDMKAIEAETITSPHRRPLRDINDWGIVAVDALTMSIRSQLSTELSYALTTFTLLSTMRGDSPNSGFPIVQCGDLLEEVLDLLEERAFDGVEDTSDSVFSDDGHLPTHRELVNALMEVETQPFACLQPRQGTKDPDLGPRQRPGNIILTIINILRNLSFIPDNGGFLSQQERLFDLMLRVCSVTTVDGKVAAVSSALSLGDVIAIRKDTLYTLMHLAGLLQFSDPPSKTALRIVSRAYQLIASYLVDPTEAVSPLACLQLAGVIGNFKPPFMADIALETFTRLVQSDVNRKVFSRAIPEASIHLLFISSVHRLPVIDPDFQLVLRERWLSYMEKTIMTIYSLVFVSSPDLKRRIKMDRGLGFKGIMLRMIQKFLMNSNHDLKAQFYISARRAVEAMKLLDDCEDSFDTSEATVATLSFGMGYGEVGENNTEKGTGLLGGHRELAWDLLMLREVHQDAVMFGELDSLSRVE
ncbi:hypothetical protein B0H15DRAFT_313165 [Mycena belliarum]|uniref:ARID domain-containing protein n=1 Tax=Mycena belliarum TaxID=1033014 RepID=A0AAD6UKH0_9AGAR|nr:hypothetical protein B0H15DRAFT_313165 [Mycena belliae]